MNPDQKSESEKNSEAVSSEKHKSRQGVFIIENSTEAEEPEREERLFIFCPSIAWTAFLKMERSKGTVKYDI
jgi:hypothetical protein